MILAEIQKLFECVENRISDAIVPRVRNRYFERQNEPVKVIYI